MCLEVRHYRSTTSRPKGVKRVGRERVNGCGGHPWKQDGVGAPTAQPWEPPPMPCTLLTPHLFTRFGVAVVDL